MAETTPNGHSFPTRSSTRQHLYVSVPLPFIDAHFPGIYVFESLKMMRFPKQPLINISDSCPVALHQQRPPPSSSSGKVIKSVSYFRHRFSPHPPSIRQSRTSCVICHSRHHQDIHKEVRAAMQSGKEMNVKSDQQQQMTKPYRSAVVYYHVGFNLRLLLLLLHLCLLFLLLHVCKDTSTTG